MTESKINQSETEVSLTFKGTLFNDESVLEKLKVMNKWDAIIDDSRNVQIPDLADILEQFLQLGETYEFQIVVRKQN